MRKKRSSMRSPLRRNETVSIIFFWHLSLSLEDVLSHHTKQLPCKLDLSSPEYCYQVVQLPTAVSYLEASYYCRNKIPSEVSPGRLAAVKSKKENNLIAHLLASKGSSRAMIGLRQKSRPWSWVSDSTPLFGQGVTATDVKIACKNQITNPISLINHRTCLNACKARKLDFAIFQQKLDHRKKCYCSSSLSLDDFGDDLCGRSLSNHSNYIYSTASTAFDNWLPGRPLRRHGCVAISTSHRNFEWVDIKCSTSLPFICQFPSIKRHLLRYHRPTRRQNSFHCSRTICIALFFKSKLTFKEANNFCKMFDGFLVKADNVKLVKTINRLIYMSNIPGANFVWIGAKKAAWFEWPDGTSVGYNNWGKWRSQGKGCVKMEIDQFGYYKWMQRSCDRYKNETTFVCSCTPMPKPCYRPNKPPSVTTTRKKIPKIISSIKPRVGIDTPTPTPHTKFNNSDSTSVIHPKRTTVNHFSKLPTKTVTTNKGTKPPLKASTSTSFKKTSLKSSTFVTTPVKLPTTFMVRASTIKSSRKSTSKPLVTSPHKTTVLPIMAVETTISAQVTEKTFSTTVFDRSATSFKITTTTLGANNREETTSGAVGGRTTPGRDLLTKGDGVTTTEAKLMSTLSTSGVFISTRPFPTSEKLPASLGYTSKPQISVTSKSPTSISFPAERSNNKSTHSDVTTSIGDPEKPATTSYQDVTTATFRVKSSKITTAFTMSSYLPPRNSSQASSMSFKDEFAKTTLTWLSNVFTTTQGTKKTSSVIPMAISETISSRDVTKVGAKSTTPRAESSKILTAPTLFSYLPVQNSSQAVPTSLKEELAKTTSAWFTKVFITTQSAKKTFSVTPMVEPETTTGNTGNGKNSSSSQNKLFTTTALYKYLTTTVTSADLSWKRSSPGLFTTMINSTSYGWNHSLPTWYRHSTRKEKQIITDSVTTVIKKASSALPQRFTTTTAFPTTGEKEISWTTLPTQYQKVTTSGKRQFTTTSDGQKISPNQLFTTTARQITPTAASWNYSVPAWFQRLTTTVSSAVTERKQSTALSDNSTESSPMLTKIFTTTASIVSTSISWNRTTAAWFRQLTTTNKSQKDFSTATKQQFTTTTLREPISARLNYSVPMWFQKYTTTTDSTTIDRLQFTTISDAQKETSTQYSITTRSKKATNDSWNSVSTWFQQYTTIAASYTTVDKKQSTTLLKGKTEMSPTFKQYHVTTPSKTPTNASWNPSKTAWFYQLTTTVGSITTEKQQSTMHTDKQQFFTTATPLAQTTLSQKSVPKQFQPFTTVVASTSNRRSTNQIKISSTWFRKTSPDTIFSSSQKNLSMSSQPTSVTRVNSVPIWFQLSTTRMGSTSSKMQKSTEKPTGYQHFTTTESLNSHLPPVLLTEFAGATRQPTFTNQAVTGKDLLSTWHQQSNPTTANSITLVTTAAGYTAENQSNESSTTIGVTKTLSQQLTTPIGIATDSSRNDQSPTWSWSFTTTATEKNEKTYTNLYRSSPTWYRQFTSMVTSTFYRPSMAVFRTTAETPKTEDQIAIGSTRPADNNDISTTSTKGAETSKEQEKTIFSVTTTSIPSSIQWSTKKKEAIQRSTIVDTSTMKPTPTKKSSITTMLFETSVWPGHAVETTHQRTAKPLTERLETTPVDTDESWYHSSPVTTEGSYTTVTLEKTSMSEVPTMLSTTLVISSLITTVAANDTKESQCRDSGVCCCNSSFNAWGWIALIILCAVELLAIAILSAFLVGIWRKSVRDFDGEMLAGCCVFALRRRFSRKTWPISEDPIRKTPTENDLKRSGVFVKIENHGNSEKIKNAPQQPPPPPPQQQQQQQQQPLCITVSSPKFNRSTQTDELELVTESEPTFTSEYTFEEEQTPVESDELQTIREESETDLLSARPASCNSNVKIQQHRPAGGKESQRLQRQISAGSMSSIAESMDLPAHLFMEENATAKKTKKVERKRNFDNQKRRASASSAVDTVQKIVQKSSFRSNKQRRYSTSVLPSPTTISKAKILAIEAVRQKMKKTPFVPKKLQRSSSTSSLHQNQPGILSRSASVSIEAVRRMMRKSPFKPKLTKRSRSLQPFENEISSLSRIRSNASIIAVKKMLQKAPFVPKKGQHRKSTLRTEFHVPGLSRAASQESIMAIRKKLQRAPFQPKKLRRSCSTVALDNNISQQQRLNRATSLESIRRHLQKAPFVPRKLQRRVTSSAVECYIPGMSRTASQESIMAVRKKLQKSPFRPKTIERTCSNGSINEMVQQQRLSRAASLESLKKKLQRAPFVPIKMKKSCSTLSLLPASRCYGKSLARSSSTGNLDDVKKRLRRKPFKPKLPQRSVSNVTLLSQISQSSLLSLRQARSRTAAMKTVRKILGRTPFRPTLRRHGSMVPRGMSLSTATVSSIRRIMGNSPFRPIKKPSSRLPSPKPLKAKQAFFSHSHEKLWVLGRYRHVDARYCRDLFPTVWECKTPGPHSYEHRQHVHSCAPYTKKRPMQPQEEWTECKECPSSRVYDNNNNFILQNEP